MIKIKNTPNPITIKNWVITPEGQKLIKDSLNLEKTVHEQMVQNIIIDPKKLDTPFIK